MRMAFDLNRHHYVGGVYVLLVAMAVTAGMVGCDVGEGEPYTLDITSTIGGAVTIPGEGTFTYDEGTVVNLVATADDDYGFQGWTGDTEGVADPDSRTTTIVISQDSSIMANFGSAGPPGPSTP